MTNNNSDQFQFPELTIRDLLRVLFRHKTKMCLFFVAVITAVAVITLLTPKTYQSVAKIIVKIGRENATLDPTVALGATLNISDSRETEINSEIELIKSREIAEQVVQKFGADVILNLKKDDPKNTDSAMIHENAVMNIMNNLVAESVKKTNIIYISFDSHNAKLAQQIVTSLIAFYQDKHMSIYRPAGSYEFFENQTDQLNKSITANEDSLLILKNSSGIASIETQRDNLIARISSIQLDLNSVNAELAASKARIASLKQTLDNVPNLISSNRLSSTNSQSSDLLRAKLNELKLKKADLLTKFLESSRVVSDIQTQIDETTDMLNKETQSSNQSDASKNLQLQIMTEQTNYASLSAKQNSLNSMLSRSKAELSQFETKSVDIARLQKKYDTDEKNFSRYSENLEQARIDHNLKSSNISNIGIVQAATLPIKPEKPRKTYNMLLGIFFGLFGALSIAFIFEFFDHSLRSRNDIESHLKVPFLGSVPFFKKQVIETHDFPRKALHTFDSIGRAVNAAISHVNHTKVIGITSCYTGEGSSFVAGRIVDSLLSFHDGDVLYADLNFENQNISKKTHIGSSLQSENLFLENKSSDTRQIASQDNNQGIVVIPAGKQTSLPIQYIQKKRFNQFINFCRTKYASVIFDMPALSESSMVLEMADHIDGLVLVIESGKVRREVIRQMVSDLSQNGINIIGVVLNKHKLHIPQFIYKRM